jgi:hypothetical protein
MTTAAFEDVISTWNEQVRCEMTTKAGARCRRPAYCGRTFDSISAAYSVTPL